VLPPVRAVNEKQGECRSLSRLLRTSLSCGACVVLLSLFVGHSAVGAKSGENSADSERKPLNVVSNVTAERLFGKSVSYSDGKKNDVPIPVTINRRSLGVELVQISPSPNINVEKMYSEALLSDLQRVMNESKLEDLKVALTGSALISREDLESLGFQVSYQVQDASVHIAVPEEWLRPINIEMAKFSEGLLTPNTFSSPLSGYVNLHASELSTAHRTASQRQNPFGLSFEGVASAHGVNLIGGGNYYDQAVKRTETALIIPWDQGYKQIWIGDTKYSNTSSVSYPELSGLSYFQKATPTAAHTDIDSGVIMTKNKSTLQIYKNESLYRTLDIGPGAFQISDLPLDLGQNVIRLVVKDQVTGEQTERIINDFLPLYSVPVGHWESVFSYGSHRINDFTGIRYYGAPVTFAGGMYGLSPLVNVGFSSYVSDDYMRISQEGRYFTSGGNFSLKLNEAKQGSESGISTRAEYSKQDIPISGVRSISLSEEFSGPGYRTIESATSSEPARTSSINVGMKPFKKIFFSFGATETKNSDGLDDVIFASLSRSYRIDREWDLLTTAGDSRSSRTSQDFRFMLSLTYSPRLDNAHWISNATATEKSASLNTSYSNEDRLTLSARTSENYNSAQVDESVSLKKEYQYAGVGATLYHNYDSSAAFFQLDSAIAFTNDTIALTRPLDQSFLIFKSENPRGVEYDVTNEQGEKILTAGGSLRSVVIPIRDYQTSQYSAGFTDPDYFTLDSSKTVVYKSGMKTGTSVSLSSDQRAIITGVLVDSKERLIKQTIVKMSCSKPDDVLSDSSFTNENGEFQFQVKRNAVCRLVLELLSSEELDLTWPVKYKDLGVIQVK
jgi:outer membrane usher protein FimD/PapC